MRIGGYLEHSQKRIESIENYRKCLEVETMRVEKDENVWEDKGERLGLSYQFIDEICV